MAAQKHGKLHFIQKRLLDPDKGLFVHKFFWIMALGPVAASVFLGFEVWMPYSLNLTEDGYKKFIEISKLPLAVMALGLPFGAIAASFHRSLQISKQIRAAERREIDSKKLELEAKQIEQSKANHLTIAKIFRLQDLVGNLKTLSGKNLSTMQYEFHANETLEIYKDLYDREAFFYYNQKAQDILRNLHGNIHGIHRTLMLTDTLLKSRNIDIANPENLKDFSSSPFSEGQVEKVEKDLQLLLDEVYSVVELFKTDYDTQLDNYKKELEGLND